MMDTWFAGLGKRIASILASCMKFVLLIIVLILIIYTCYKCGICCVRRIAKINVISIDYVQVTPAPETMMLTEIYVPVA